MLTSNMNVTITRMQRLASLALFLLLIPALAISGSRDTTLSQSLSSNSIQTNTTTFTVTVKLRVGGIPAPASHLFGHRIFLELSGPNGELIAKGSGTNDQGEAVFNLGPELWQAPGSWEIITRYQGPDFQPSNSQIEYVTVNTHAGFVILIEGAVSGFVGEDSHNKSANNVYRTLKNLRNFEDQRIYYFNQAQSVIPPDIQVDNVPSLSVIDAAVNDIINKVASGADDPGPVHFILVNHGNVDKFHLNDGGEVLDPGQLDNWLEQLESIPQIRAWPRTVTLAACFSGSFIPTLSKSPFSASRVIVTSGSDDEETLKGPLESDGVRIGSFFLEEFQQELKRGLSFEQAFNPVAERTRVHARADDADRQLINQYNDNSRQHPLLDDNQDKIGTHALSNGSPLADGQVAKKVHLGYGPNLPPDNGGIGITPEVYESTPGTYTLSVFSSESKQCTSATAFVRVPGAVVPAPTGSSEQLNSPYVTVPLIFTFSNGVGTIFFDNFNFTTPGKYEVLYFLEGCNQRIGRSTISLTSIFYIDAAGNLVPEPTFNLLFPGADLSTPIPNAKTRQLFDWQQALDKNGDAVTYNLFIADETGGSCETDPGTGVLLDPIFSRYGIPSSQTYVGGEGGLTDLGTYCWQVQAVDPFGGRSPSDTFRMRSDDTNFFGGVVGGNMRRAGSSLSLVGAVATISSRSATSDEGGYYVIEGLPVPIAATANVTKPGFNNASSSVNVQQTNALVTQNFNLVPFDTDLNNDGVTNGLDVGLLKLAFGTSDPNADFNGDGIVNGLDVGIMKIHFGKPAPP